MNRSTTSTMQRTIRAALLAAIAGTVMVPGASAQSVNETRSIISTSNADNAARVEVRADKFKITLNGKEVKSGLLSDVWTDLDLVDENGESVGTVTRTGDEFGIVLNDENGDPVSTAGNLFSGSAQAHRAAIIAERDAVRAAMRASGGAQAPIARAYATAAGQWGNPPRTMLGVTLDNPGEALCAQLGIDREKSTILTSVTDGLPASKSGLKLYDVITDVNGESASPDTLRKFLREKNAGDTLNLKVVSAGSRKDVVVNLESYDAGKLNVTTAGAWAPSNNAFGGGGLTGSFTVNTIEDDMQENSRKLEELAEQLKQAADGLQNSKDAKAMEAFSERMNKIGEEMSKHGEEMARAGTGNWFINPSNPQGTRTIIGRRGGSGQSLPFTITPTPPTAPMPAIPGGMFTTSPRATEETAALKERIDQLEARLSKLDSMDEKLAQLTEMLQVAAKNQGSGKKDQ